MSTQLSHSKKLNVLLVKIGTEPGLEPIVMKLKELSPSIKTYGVVGSRDQLSFLDEIVTTSDEAILAAHEEYVSDNLFVTPDLYQRMSVFEGRLLRMLERVAIHDLTKVKQPNFPIPTFRDSTEERSQLLLRQIAFWENVFRVNDIDAVVAQNYGHNGWDAVVQLVAKALRIPYLYFHEVRPFLGSLYVHEEIEDIGSLALGRALIGEAEEKYGLVKDSSTREIRLLREAGIDQSPKESTIIRFESRTVERIVARFGSPRHLPHRVVRSLRRRIRNSRSMRDEKAAVNCGPLPLHYVFCELQSQPNATTAVKGWMFPDQRESVALVAKYLPEGWKLVVKESDRQWSRMYPRRRNYWSQIAAISKVHVVGHEESSSELMRNARLVLETSFSSIAFSAITQGKPVLILGHTHLQELPQVFVALSEEDVSTALSKIVAQSTSIVDEQTIKDSLSKFAARTKEATLEGSLSSMPKFLSVAEREKYIERVTHNTAAVISVWLDRMRTVRESR